MTMAKARMTTAVIAANMLVVLMASLVHLVTSLFSVLMLLGGVDVLVGYSGSSL